jgi:phage internal scaffolding protein
MASRFRSAYSPRVKVALSFLDEEGNPLSTPTQQHMKAEVDINNILRQYDRTGLITHVNNATAQYGDFTEVNEYQESLNRVIAAQDAFAALPSNVRKRFANDPGEFFEFATNPDNFDAMVELGLAERPSEVVQASKVEAPVEGE